MRDEVRLPPNYQGDQPKVNTDLEITLRYSIDREITKAEERVQALKDTKKRLEERGVLDCQVRDLKIATREIY